jgi:hypothetical protein
MAKNIDKVQIVAHALCELKEQVVFVGGSVTELYADNPELSDIRPTIDVDCVMDLQIVTYLDYSNLEERLRKLGFQNDMSENAPICRKIYQGILVDFMPVNPDILGFSNLWYKDGVNNKTSITLPDGASIFILSVEYYLATKLEAMHSRGGADIRGSYDWEDIVYVLDNCGKLLQNIQQCNNTNLIEYLKEKFDKLLDNNNIKEIIYSALPYNSDEESVNKVFVLMNEIRTM